jgi:hypothetical protein
MPAITRRGFLVSNEELIASTQHTVLVLRRLAKSEAHAASAAFYEDVALVLEGLAVALEAQSAPLVAESREALARWHSPEAWRKPHVPHTFREDMRNASLAAVDDLITSGVVSLAADRDRAMKAEVWPKAFYAGERHMMEHQAFTDPEEHNPYRESEGK